LGGYAQEYAYQGWEVFPLIGKTPAIRSPHPRDFACKGECGRDGHGIWDATSDPGKIAAWWKSNPYYNIGLRPHPNVMVIDIDNFKLINDHYGHEAGDRVLRAVGQRLQAQLRASDVVARLGGDEFVVLAAGLPDEGSAHALGQKMLNAFDEPFSIEGQPCRVGLTAGYALAPLDGQSADELIKRADAAMYAGKEAGRHRVQRGGRSLAAA
jgi:diguanylate cyclase (GGDEF)-like protein